MGNDQPTDPQAAIDRLVARLQTLDDRDLCNVIELTEALIELLQTTKTP